jgi:hypothetical protein
MDFGHSKTGRPSKRADLNAKSVAISFRIDPALKNLLLDVANGSDMSMTDMLLTLVLRESGFDSLAAYRDTIEDVV